MATPVELVHRFLDTLEARDWAGLTEVLDPDVVYEMPQSRERIRGRDSYVQFNREYPGDWHLRPRVVLADEGHGIAWFDWNVGDDEQGDGIVVLGIDGDRIRSVTDFWPEPFEPRPGREHLVERW